MKKSIKSLLTLSCFVLGLNLSQNIFAAADTQSGDTSVAKVHVRHSKTAEHATDTAPVNINTASAEEFATIKGIGPKKAQAIVDYREQNGPFKSVDDLSKVKGLGAKSLQRIQNNNPGRLVMDTTTASNS